MSVPIYPSVMQDNRQRSLKAVILASQKLLPLPFTLPLLGVITLTPAQAQPITSDGSTGTTVTPEGNLLNISGGQLCKDGTNLFHSFSQFGLDSNQVANFLSNPTIYNILARVTGGNPSVIDGVLQVSGGNSNLYLINPAGIVFGQNAQLNVPASFTATTATGIGIGNNWFSATGGNNYDALMGTPNLFAFNTLQPGAIINAGQLSVKPGETLSLLGGTVVSTGKLSAPEGQITVAAVPGNNLLRLSQPGRLLSLEITSSPSLPFTPLSLPQLLTGGNASNATGLVVNGKGQVELTGSGMAVEPGDVVAKTATAQNALLWANHNLTLVESQLQTTGDLHLLAQNTVRVRDSVTHPFLAKADGNIYLQGNQNIDILALNHPQTPFQSGGNMTLVSDGNTSTDAHFSSGGSFSILNSAGTPGNVVSWYDPIFSSNGNVRFGNYQGVALKVEARGSITAGNITITGPDTSNIPATDPHFGILTTSPALVLQAGKTTLDNPPNFAGGEPSAGTIQVGSINTSSLISGINGGTVLMEATSGITLAGINANWLGAAGTGNGGTITLRTTNGNLTSSTRNITSISRNGNAGNITLEVPNGAIEVRDVYSRANGIGNGGNITLTAANAIRTGDIETSGVNGGDIRLISRNGRIDTTQRFNGRIDPGIISSGGSNGRAGSITLEAPTQIVTRGVRSNGTSGSGDISLTSDQIDFLPTGNTPPAVRGTGNLIIQPYTPNQDIELGGSGSTAALDLSRSELEALQAGFRSITIGRSNGTGNIRVNATNFRSPVTIQAPGGAIAVNDNLNAIGNASITLNAATTTLNANIATQQGDITVGNNVLLGRDITFNSNSGNITFNGTVNGNQNLTLSSGTGTTLFKGIVGGTTPLNLLTTDTGGTTLLNGNVTANRLVFNDPVIVASDLALTATDINFGSTVSGTGTNLVLQPLTPRQNFTLTAAGAFQDGFRSLTIGRNNGSGSIVFNSNLTFNDPVTILAPTGNGSITATGTITGLGDAAITLNANQDITIGDIFTKGSAITLISNQGAVNNTGNLNSSGVSGGSITVKARTQLRTGNINSSGTQDNGGNVTLDSNSDIQVVSINAQGGRDGTGGNVDVSSRQFFRASGAFTDRTGTTSSISTAGGIRGGSITIRHGGGLVGKPFTVGPNYNGTNGARGAITTGSNNQIQSGVYPRRYTQGTAPNDIRLITVGQDPSVNPTLPSVNPTLPSVNPVLPSVNPTLPSVNPVLPSVNPILPSNPSNPTQASASGPAQERQLPQQSSSPQEAINVNPPGVEINTVGNPVDELFTRQFETYLGRSNTRIRSLSSARQLLQQIEKATGVKPALIYVYFVPANTSSDDSFSTVSSDHPDDQLELLLVTAKGNPIRKRVNVKRRHVLKAADSFRSTVTNISNKRGYFAPAQQLYRWLVAPLEQDLQAQGIHNLTFIMDTGLRSIPVAALHDRHQFLVERYSIGLMPSLSLTDIGYQDIKDSQVLAMGAEKFVNQKPLPAVPLELRVITKQLWKGKVFLDNAFTLENLKAQRNRTPFGIIHLATHANFKPGKPSNSYIQLWNSKLSFDQLPQLGWKNPPVELLVLSACRTALGDEQAELGFAGLAVQAGAKSAVASLWSVNDEGTLALMTNFYQHLRTARIKVEALQQAQVAMLKGQVKIENGQLLMPGSTIPLPPELANLRKKQLSHPYYWSAFTLVGNPW